MFPEACLSCSYVALQDWGRGTETPHAVCGVAKPGLRAQYVSNPENTLREILLLTCMAILCGRHCSYPHFTDKKTEAQRGQNLLEIT